MLLIFIYYIKNILSKIDNILTSLKSLSCLTYSPFGNGVINDFPRHKIEWNVFLD